MRKYILILLMAAMALSVHAQNNSGAATSRQKITQKNHKSYLLRRQENGDFIYDHEFSGGARLNTNGWSGFLEYGRRKDDIITNIYQLEIGEIKNIKEDKTIRPTGYLSVAHFVYGKQNIFYQVKLSIGQRHLIGGKSNKNGVEVSAIYQGGITVGILRPYYLEVADSSSQGSMYVKYSAQTRNDFLTRRLVRGGTGLKKGWNELSVVPGLQARLGLRFDWAAFNSAISAIEVSINGEAYSKKIPIMILSKNKQFFFNASVALVFGKRW